MVKVRNSYCKSIKAQTVNIMVTHVIYCIQTHPEQRRLLTNLKGEEWKVLRSTLSPTFTAGMVRINLTTFYGNSIYIINIFLCTGKLRNIVGGISTCGPNFVEYIRGELKRNNGGPIKMTDVLKR